MEGRSPLNHKVASLIVLFTSFFLALAIMDYAVSHSQYIEAEWQYPAWLYKYWMGLGLIVVTFASSVAYAIYAFNAPKRYAIASFATVILLFVGGFLDLFYACFSYIRGEPYGFDYWSAQYKWLGSWTWPQQVAWTLICLIGIYLAWRWALRSRR